MSTFDFLQQNGFAPQMTSDQIANFGATGAAPVTAPGTPIVPQMPSPNGATGATGGLFGKIGGLEGIGAITQGLASLGQLYGAIKGVKLAEKQFDFTKGAYETNLKNSTKSYNNQFRDQITSRYVMEGKSDKDAANYLQKHQL